MPVIDHRSVLHWVAGYETAWRTPGTELLADLYSVEATYLTSPYEEPIVGLRAPARRRLLALGHARPQARWST